MRIVVDAMGGDHGPVTILQGVKLAMQDFRHIEKFVLVGDPERLPAALETAGLQADHPRLELVPATQVVEMHEPSAVALRAKKDSSITVAAGVMRDGGADALVSAGHTGAAVACSVVRNRMLDGVDRPGIAAVFPGVNGPFLMLDVGANVDAKPLHLAQYAIMGEAYARDILKIAQPKVGILNVGGEDGKGNELTKESFKLLKRTPVNFVGSAEGHDMFNGGVDVFVCDGFVGNVVLKSCESLAKAISGILKTSLRKTPVRMAGAFLSQNAFRELRLLTDHEEYGGAPLLGINGTCIIAHGSSSPKAIRNALRVAAEMVTHQLNRQIAETVSTVDWKDIAAAV